MVNFKNSLLLIFKNKGYTVNSIHANNGGFYSRTNLHKAYGYENHYDSYYMITLTGKNGTYTKLGFIKVSNYGPICFSVSDTKSIRPYGFTIHTQDSWQKITTDTLTINLIRPEGSSIDYQFILK